MVVNIKGPKNYKLIVYVNQNISNHVVIIYEKKQLLIIVLIYQGIIQSLVILIYIYQDQITMINYNSMQFIIIRQLYSPTNYNLLEKTFQIKIFLSIFIGYFPNDQHLQCRRKLLIHLIFPYKAIDCIFRLFDLLHIVPSLLCHIYCNEIFNYTYQRCSLPAMHVSASTSYNGMLQSHSFLTSLVSPEDRYIAI